MIADQPTCRVMLGMCYGTTPQNCPRQQVAKWKAAGFVQLARSHWCRLDATRQVHLTVLSVFIDNQQAFASLAKGFAGALLQFLPPGSPLPESAHWVTLRP